MPVKYLVSDNSGTHLPYTKSDGTPDHRLMGAAFAALHGGYRGKNYEGPKKAAAISKLAAVYKDEKMTAPSESFFVPEPKDSIMYEADGTTLKGDSFNSIRDRVQDSIQQSIRDGEDMDLDGDNDSNTGSYGGCDYAYVMDLFPTTVIYSMNGDLFQCEYHDDGDAVTLGTPVEVEQSYTVVATAPPEDAADESGRALVGAVVQLDEAAYDAAKGQLTMTVIKPGFSKNQTQGRQRFYPAKTLKRDHKIFEGAKMFADHQTEKEAKDRPEGSVNNWVATLGKTWTEADGTVKANADVIDPAFKAKLGALSEKGLLNQMGVSVRIGAEISKAQIEGQEAVSIDSILSNRSVDFVTYAGAGGQVEVMESDSDSSNDLELASEAQLRECRPDLVKLIEAQFEATYDSKSNGREALMKSIEEKLQESEKALAAEKKRAETAEAKASTLQETINANPDQVAVAAANKRAQIAEANAKDAVKAAEASALQVETLTTQLEEADAVNKKAAARAELVKLLGESKLPDIARTKLTAKFAEATSTEGMKEAIAYEVGYIKSVGGTAKVTSLGERHNTVTVAEADRTKNRIAIMKQSGMTEAQAEIAARGR